MRFSRYLTAAIFSLGCVSFSYSLDFAEKVNVNLELRPRWEHADVSDNNLKDADALTMRTRVGVNFKNLFKVKNLNLLFEPWVVTAFVEEYSPEKQGYDLIADPKQTRINQVYLSYKMNFLNFKVGRQIIIFDNHRFIGNVGWRQMAQTFDAVRLDIEPVKGLDITASYVFAKTGVTTNVAGEGSGWVFAPHNTQIGDDVPVNDSLLLHANYKIKPVKMNITGYAYLINGLHDTYGLKVNGTPISLGNVSLGVWLEYALQNDPTLDSHENTKKNIEASYYYVNLKPTYKSSFGKLFLQFEYEFLEGADRGETNGFTTPLATLHAHDGWADAFLRYVGTSNIYGLKELKVGAGFSNKTIGNFLVKYIQFESDKDFPGGGNKFGNEVDILYKRKLLKNLVFGAKAALYNADNEAKNAGVADKDITKYWVWVTYKWASK